MRIGSIAHRFVGNIPERLDPATLYVSLPHATAVHLCACGCGSEVVTPIDQTDWTLTWDGTTVSLEPSVGSAALPCRSHYFLRRGRVVWLPRLAGGDPSCSRGSFRIRTLAAFLERLARIAGGGGRGDGVS